ncbi:MAG: AzlD domain-containing protein [Clostridia bacterium]|jgi:branched-subunit amino acid transport protein|nr:AzlD domain-containing protein [Clostridia bacterium]
MDSKFLLILSLVLFGISCLMRMIPLIFCKGKIKSKFLNSFLYYIPFAVMTSIVIPEVFNSTSSVVSAVSGVVLAVVLGLLGQNMLVIALSSTALVFIIENFILHLFN